MSDEVSFVKNDIIDFFRTLNARAGDMLPMPLFNNKRRNNYNPKQEAVFGQAVEELVAEGLLEKRDGKILLTPKGVDEIY